MLLLGFWLVFVELVGSDAKDFLFWRVVWAWAIPIGARVVGSASLLLVHATARAGCQFGRIGSRVPWLILCRFWLTCGLTYRLVLSRFFITVTSWVEISFVLGGIIFIAWGLSFLLRDNFLCTFIVIRNVVNAELLAHLLVIFVVVLLFVIIFLILVVGTLRTTP